MKHPEILVPFTCLVACGQPPESIDETTHEIVNGAVNTTAEFQAVVSLAIGNAAVERYTACSGTFIHPNFVLTAAHCFPTCSSTITTGCTEGDKDSAVIKGIDHWTGHDGPVGKPTTICDGFGACFTDGDGVRHAADLVFFPKPEQFVYTNREPLDLAIVHTTNPFAGRPIPVMDAKTLPQPTNLCTRYEGSRPYIAGFSDNNATLGTRQRRVGLTEVECDLEMEERAFNVDGDGADFVGARGCEGDSGGPALWRNGSGALELGGVMSYTDKYDLIITNTNCPSSKGETGLAFVARAFIDSTVSSLTVSVLGADGTVTATPAGISCTASSSSDCTEQYDLGKVVTLQATPAPNNLFTGWSGACAGTSPTCTVSVRSALRVTASFATPTQPLTVRALPAGSGGIRITPPSTVCSGTCMRSVPYGSGVTLTALPAPGYVLANWAGSCAGAHTTTCNLSMTAARSATANFCPQDDACCLNPAACQSCNPKQCPKDDPFCC